MKFLVVIDGSGDGCDYTIGCNVRVDHIEAHDMAEAVATVERDIGGFAWSPTEGQRFARVSVYAVAEESSIDIDALTSRAQEQYTKQDRAAKMAKLAREMERLKAEDA